MIIFLAVAALAFSSNSETLLYMLQVNAVVQLTLFILVACIPFLKNRAYVLCGYSLALWGGVNRFANLFF